MSRQAPYEEKTLPFTSLKTYFTPGKTYFLTVKSDKEAHQRIGWVRDLVRQYSTTYYVVREANKVKKGYHFHALLRLEGPPPKRFFKKGVHMHLLCVGRKSHPDADGRPDLEGVTQEGPVKFTKLELADMRHDGYADHELVATNQLFSSIHRAHVKTKKKHDNVANVLNYMHKERPSEALQYVDYLLVVRGKSVALSE